MLQDKLIDAAQRQEAHPGFAAGPLLTELLSDPIMHMLMAADRVEYQDLDAFKKPVHSSAFLRSDDPQQQASETVADDERERP